MQRVRVIVQPDEGGIFPLTDKLYGVIQKEVPATLEGLATAINAANDLVAFLVAAGGVFCPSLDIRDLLERCDTRLRERVTVYRSQIEAQRTLAASDPAGRA